MESPSYLSQGKIFSHLDRLQDLLETGHCLPVTIQIDPTNKCNRDCPKCAGNRFGSQKQLSLDFMQSVIDQTKTFCRGIIITGGGEPLCNEDTVAAIKYAKSKGIEMGLVSNGDALNGQTAEELTNACSYVRISLIDEKSWDKVGLLVKAKRQNGNACTIGIGFLTDKNRAPQMENAVETARNAQVDYLQFRPYHLDTFDAGENIQRLQRKYNRDCFKVICSEYKYTNMQEKAEKVKKYPVCLSDNLRAVISADGKVYPDCFTRGIKSFCLGDLHKDSFLKIWESKRRKRIQQSKLNFSDCPPMSFHDPLDELLWNVYQQYKQGKHVNFI